MTRPTTSKPRPSNRPASADLDRRDVGRHRRHLAERLEVDVERARRPTAVRAHGLHGLRPRERDRARCSSGSGCRSALMAARTAIGARPRGSGPRWPGRRTADRCAARDGAWRRSARPAHGGEVPVLARAAAEQVEADRPVLGERVAGQVRFGEEQEPGDRRRRPGTRATPPGGPAAARVPPPSRRRGSTAPAHRRGQRGRTRARRRSTLGQSFRDDVLGVAHEYTQRSDGPWAPGVVEWAAWHSAVRHSSWGPLSWPRSPSRHARRRRTSWSSTRTTSGTATSARTAPRPSGRRTWTGSPPAGCGSRAPTRRRRPARHPATACSPASTPGASRAPACCPGTPR